MNTLDFLLKKYGVLLTTEQLADVLNRTPKGLATTLQYDNELSRMLLPARRRIGRRILFETAIVAKQLGLADEMQS